MNIKGKEWKEKIVSEIAHKTQDLEEGILKR